MAAGRPDPSTAGGTEDRDWQRLDKWLWCARFMKARSDCARLVGEGMVRINRQPTDKAHARLRVGDVLTLPLRGRVLVVAVRALAIRRGPATEARLLYHEIAPAEVDAAPPHTCGSDETAAYPAPDPIPTRSPQ
ncbi:Ribosome-associated heat shock protein implicated in the recycling of the 50S subunit (S4 paralog) [Rhodovastum atsumiense]|uniref:RNA-binding S4 domain-containing protein n=1 Tax=Rhodovastum atsumiense TaxID=504468 RepID=UPI001EEF8CBB|nr:S4 domain-containing protein [Rhodovastum atsumiense]CAH2599582.1 Ribosome-associated heat shock protein implicated in the recycling of the 50S subunit (S4 paralog) [Rhodovastum atsumiense]